MSPSPENQDPARLASRLEMARRDMEAFAYSVSHDLGAPLRHIRGYSDMLERGLGDRLEGKNAKYLEVIRESALEMEALIAELLEFSRLGRVEMNVAEVDQDGLLRACMLRLEHLTMGRKVEWEVGPLPSVRGDRSMVEQVWMHLLENALKFTRKTSHARISISADPETGVVHVRDNGIGFNQEYAGKLFGLFQRMHRREDFEGRGCGLAKTRCIIQRHGGRIWADARVDEGASFHFTLAGPTLP